MHDGFRRSALTALAAVSLACVSAPAVAQDGFGQTLSVPVRATTSARAAFREALGALPGFAQVRLQSAFGDKTDRFVEGFFTATYRGMPAAGALLAGRDGVAVVAFDRPDRIAQTLPPMLARIAASAPRRVGNGGAVLPLRSVSFGSGSIGLPDSWQVTNSYQGCVEAASVRDHGYLAFGCPQAGFAPPVLPGTNPRAVLVLPLTDPVTMFHRFAQYPQPVGLGVQSIRIAEYQAVPPPVANGRSSYILFDYRVNGAAYRGLALISVAPVDAHSFMFYKSMFMLPAARFPMLAPTMWQSWRSWGVNSGVLTGRLTAAAQSMRETGDIITGAYWDRQNSDARTALGFSQYIRDAATLENVQTGRRYNGSYLDARAIVDYDPAKYRIVPVTELRP